MAELCATDGLWAQVMIELYRKHVWHDAKTVNVRSALSHTHSRANERMHERTHVKLILILIPIRSDLTVAASDRARNRCAPQ